MVENRLSKDYPGKETSCPCDAPHAPSNVCFLYTILCKISIKIVIFLSTFDANGMDGYALATAMAARSKCLLPV